MANKFATGSYYIKIYDKYGTKQHAEFGLGCYTEAKDLGDYFTENNSDSFTVSMVIYNSLDGDKWG